MKNDKINIMWKSVSSIQKLEHNGFIYDYVGPRGEDYIHNKTQLENRRPTENNRD